MLQNLRRTRQWQKHDSPGARGLPEIFAYGDTLVVWRLIGFGRSLGNLIQLTNELQSRRIDLESLTEKLDTGSPSGQLVLHVFAALAEFERNLIRERTLAGPLGGSRSWAQRWSTEKAPS